ncbi:MAG TPA: nicotinate phosphoribosyltransferase [Deinococcales bacterium]|nr:nicotinate phosphoribosyltransferase [Deinococcales bacterium]
MTPDDRRDPITGDPLFTDLYELTMAAGYVRYGLHEQPATFDLYFRRAPFGGSFAILAGLEPALRHLEALRFTPQHLDYLAGLKLFDPAFLDYLRGWRFRASVSAAPEGTAVFPHEPILTVSGPLLDAQLVESALLNLLNFQTLVATKAMRLRLAAGENASVVEFGLRRAQGPDGALSASRAATIGGASGTSNVLAGLDYGLPLSGTHAHAWVQAFETELEAFRAYARLYPDGAVLLLDTFDTLGSGLPNAVRVGLELREAGHELAGVRLDSGDLAYLSREVRAGLDAAGLNGVKIVASNDLDEQVIESVRREGGRVDVWGVGTRLVTAEGEGALGGVYKLVELNGEARMKVTADPAKSSLPGRKVVWRAEDERGRFVLDAMALPGQPPRPGELLTDPTNPLKATRAGSWTWRELHQPAMTDGRIVAAFPGLAEARERSWREVNRLPEGATRPLNPHRYRVSLTEGLAALRDRTRQRLEAAN